MTITSPGKPAPTVLARYLNQCGALVLMIERPSAVVPGLNYRGECTGCLEDIGPYATVRPVRDWASTHARECRALPQHGEQAEDVTIYLADGGTQTFKGVTRERAAEIELTLGSSPNIARIDVEPAS